MIITALHRIIRNPPLVIFLSYMLLTFLGAVLLFLDVSHINKGAFSFIDAFFTSASAVTITGLIVKDTSQFTLFGHGVILALFQLGGVGIMMSFAFLFVLFKKHLKLQTQRMMKEVLDADVVSEVIHIIKFVVMVSFVAELTEPEAGMVRAKPGTVLYLAKRESEGEYRAAIFALGKSTASFQGLRQKLAPPLLFDKRHKRKPRIFNFLELVFRFLHQKPNTVSNGRD